MAFKMGLTKEDLSGPPPVPPGIYELQVTGFRPKVSKNGESLNHNGEFTVYGNPAFENRKVFDSLNTSFSSMRDFVHACGLQMEKVVIEGTEIQVLPGLYEDADKNPDDPTKWGKYIGPLTNKIFKAELCIVPGWQGGRDRNAIKMYFCAVPNCATLEPDLKHSTNLVKG